MLNEQHPYNVLKSVADPAFPYNCMPRKCISFHGSQWSIEWESIGWIHLGHTFSKTFQMIPPNVMSKRSGNLNLQEKILVELACNKSAVSNNCIWSAHNLPETMI